MILFIPFLSGVALFFLFPFFPFSSAAIFLTASAVSVYKKKILIIPLLCLGALYAFYRCDAPDDAAGLWNRELRLTGSFAPGRETTASGRQMRTFMADTVIDHESGEEVEGPADDEFTVFTDHDVDYDSSYELLLQAGKDRSVMNPGWDRPGRPYGVPAALARTGEAPFSVTRKFDEFRDRLDRQALESFSPEAAGLVISITTGRTEHLSEELKHAFSSTGLAHILSISGTHFGLFSVMLYGMFAFLIRRLPQSILLRLTLHTTPSEVAAVITLPFMIFYLGLSGSSPPAVRSFVTIALFLAGLLIGRKGVWLNSLAFAAFILALWDPATVLSLSFQLSFLAVLFIGYCVDKGRRDPGEDEDGTAKENRVLRFVKYSALLTLVVSIGTAPLVAYNFHYISVISPLSNLIAAPLIGSLLVALALISSFSYLLTGSYLLKPLVGLTADWSVSLVRLLSDIPHAEIAVPAFPPALCLIFYGGFLLYLLLGRKRILLLIPALPFVLYMLMTVSEKNDISITFLDVGQGDSAVVQLPDRKTLVVDTGRTGRETTAFLAYEGIRDVDALVLTHDHPDHAGGADYLSKRFRVHEVWRGSPEGFPTVGSDMKGDNLSDSLPAALRLVERGDTVSGSGYDITVLHPYPEFYTSGTDDFAAENDASIVLRISGKGHSFLLAGDIDEEAGDDLSHLGDRIKSSLIKIPHHGGRSSANPVFLDQVSPEIAVISAGRGNAFGHPSPEMLELLEGRRIYRTDLDGAIKITETGAGLEAKTYRDFMFEKADSLTAVSAKKEFRNIRRLFETW